MSAMYRLACIAGLVAVLILVGLTGWDQHVSLALSGVVIALVALITLVPSPPKSKKGDDDAGAQ